MIGTQVFLANHQRLLVIDFSLNIIPLQKEIFGQIIEAIGYIRMILPQCLFMNSERSCNNGSAAWYFPSVW